MEDLVVPASPGNGGSIPTSEWPPVPPAPAPIIPAHSDSPAILATIIERPVQGPNLGSDTTARPRTVTYEVDDDSPTMSLPTGLTGPAGQSSQPGRTGGAARLGQAGARQRPRGLVPGTLPAIGGAEEPPLLALRQMVRRQNTLLPSADSLVWQPRFAYLSAIIITVALTVISLPLWLVLYRASGTGAPVRDLIALCMMLTGGYLTGAAIWFIVVEMRARVRMVDRLARTGEREVGLASAAPERGGPEERHDPYQVSEPLPSLSERGELIGWEAPPMPPAITARVEAQQASATATLDASSRLLSSFSTVLRSFGQLPAQVALLAVALALFVSATVLSLN